MINREQARQIVKNKLPETMDIMDEYTLEKKYGWVFFSQTKKYIESRNYKHKAIGSGGTLVEKSTGNIYRFGSSFILDENLKIYELGYFKYKIWDIIINQVNNEIKTIEYLSKLDIQYVIPEKAYGEIWKIAKTYTPKQIKQKLQKLPVRFCIGHIYFQYKIVESLKEQNAFIYELVENQGYLNEI